MIDTVGKLFQSKKLLLLFIPLIREGIIGRESWFYTTLRITLSLPQTIQQYHSATIHKVLWLHVPCVTKVLLITLAPEDIPQTATVVAHRRQVHITVGSKAPIHFVERTRFLHPGCELTISKDAAAGNGAIYMAHDYFLLLGSQLERERVSTLYPNGATNVQARPQRILVDICSERFCTA